MPTGPDGQKRSRDPLKAALQVAKIATGERQEQPPAARRRRLLHVTPLPEKEATQRPHSPAPARSAVPAPSSK